MTPAEWKTHFSAWCVTSSPLVLGFDVINDTIRAEAYPIISNALAIRINQAWAGEAGRLVFSSEETFVAVTAEHANDECENGKPSYCQHVNFPEYQIWAKTMPDPYAGWQAVLLINLGNSTRTINMSISDVGITTTRAQAQDVWSDKSSTLEGIVSELIEPHGSAFLLMSPSPDSPSKPQDDNTALVLTAVGIAVAVVAAVGIGCFIRQNKRCQGTRLSSVADGSD